MKKKIEKLIARQREIIAAQAGKSGEEFDTLQREYDANKREIELLNQQLIAAKNAPEVKLDRNARMREVISAIRKHEIDNDFVLSRDSQSIVTSSILSDGDLNNMTSAGLPVTIGDLINPLEMPLIYNKLGIKVNTNVHGQLQWPCLDSYAEVSVGGETDEVSASTLDFSKIVATPYKLAISIEVSNEAINDAAFDLVGLINKEMNKALGRALDKRVLKADTTVFGAKPAFVGPLVSLNQAGSAYTIKAQTHTFTGASNTTAFTTKEPTYKDLKAMKGKVLGTGAEMAGFCYIMDAAVYSFLEAQPKDAGSGRYIIEDGKIDGDPVYVSANVPAKKVIAGCFGYEALNSHGEMHLIVDPYTKAKKGVVVFTLTSDWSLTELVSAANTKGEPFCIGS